MSTLIKTYPNITNAMRMYQEIGGNQTGILPAKLVSLAKIAQEPFLRTMTAAMPKYHRLVFDNATMNMQYHLAGYGANYEEAITRLSGEAVERYAAIMAMKCFEKKIEYASYKTLSSRNDCLPLEYLAIFDAEQQKNINKTFHQYSPTLPTENDIIAWIPCPALNKPGRNIYVPAQLMFLGFQSNKKYKDKLFTASFSTGTAAHVSLPQALQNALIEITQIDAYILNWYTNTAKAPKIELNSNDYNLLKEAGLEPNGPYQIIASYLTRPEIPLPNIGITLIRKDKKIPHIAFGLQADANPNQALLRAAAEANAILSMGNFSAIFDLPKMLSIKQNDTFADLDTNVLYYANSQNVQQKLDTIQSRLANTCQLNSIKNYANSTEENIQKLVRDISKISQWGTYLDITPPELANTSWKVIRVLTPELLSMCLPGFPSKAHPRILDYGGVKNVAPHPLP